MQNGCRNWKNTVAMYSNKQFIDLCCSGRLYRELSDFGFFSTDFTEKRIYHFRYFFQKRSYFIIYIYGIQDGSPVINSFKGQ